MKKILSAFLLCSCFTMITGCSSNKPEAVAQKFLNGIYRLDYDMAKSVATDDAQKTIELMEETIQASEEEKKIAEQNKVEIKDVKEDGDHAIIIYTAANNPAEQSLTLIKENGKWLVEWSMYNFSGGNPDMNYEPMNEMPLPDTIHADTSSAIDPSRK